jgi:hypothetical protein
MLMIVSIKFRNSALPVVAHSSSAKSAQTFVVALIASAIQSKRRQVLSEVCTVLGYLVGI